MAIQRVDSSPSYPVPSGLAVMIRRGREAFEYQGGERSDRRVTDENGVPITRITATGVLKPDVVDDFTVEVPDALTDGLAEGDFVQLHGSNMLASLRGADFGAVRTKITGVEKVERLGRASDLFKAPAPRKGE